MISIFIIVTSLVVPGLVVGPGLQNVQEDFGNKQKSIEITFLTEGSKVVNIPVFSNATYDYCTMNVMGKSKGGLYPSNVTVDVGDDGIIDWGFQEKMGIITTLGDDSREHRFDLTGEQKYDTETYIAIPTGSTVSSASLNMTPKGGYTESLFINIGPVGLMSGVGEEMWYAVDSEALLRQHIVTENIQVFTNSDGLNNSKITALAADEDFVYAGSEEHGVSIYDREKDEFSAHRWEADTLGTNTIRYLHSNGERVFIVTDLAVHVFNKFGDFGNFLYTWEPTPGQLSSVEITDIETLGTNVYLGTTEGVSIYNRNTFNWINLNESNGLLSDNVQDMVVDDDMLYMATDKGISRYDYTIRDFLPEIDSYHLPDDDVSHLAQNSTSIFAVAAYGGYDSVTKISKSTGKAVGDLWYQGNRNIGDDDFTEMGFFGGYLYLATPTGVFRGEFPQEEFREIPLSNNQILSNSVTDVAFDSDDDIVYIVTEDGVSRYDGAKQLFVEPWTENTGLEDNDGTSILLDPDSIYVGTSRDGVARWSRTDEDWGETIDRRFKLGLESNKISALGMDEECLYIGHDKGIDRYSKADDLVIGDPRWDVDVFNASSKGVIVNDIVSDNEYVYVAQESVFSSFEIASIGGLWCFNKTDVNKTWVQLTNQSGVGANLSSNELLSLDQDSESIFIGTDNGLNILNKDTWDVEIINLSTESSFLGGAIYDIYHDNSTYPPQLYMAAAPVMNETLGYEVGGGLLVFNLIAKQVIKQMNRTVIGMKMTSDNITSIEKYGNVLLMGTQEGGLIRVNLGNYGIMDPSQSLGDRQFPSDLLFDLGNDGDIEETIDVFNAPVNIDIADKLNLLLHYSTSSITKYGVEFSVIPINISIHPESAGIIMMSDLHIEYEYEHTVEDFSSTLNTYISELPDGEDNLRYIPVRVYSKSPGVVLLTAPMMMYRIANTPVASIVKPLSWRGGTVYKNSIRVEFDASGSYDPDGEPLEYRWSSDNETNLRGTQRQFTAYLTKGRHNISLNVSDPTGRYSISNVIIDVEGNLPPVSIIASPQSEETFFNGQPVTFSGEGSEDPDGDELLYTWYDSTHAKKKIGTGKTLIRPFEIPGKYNITLSVSDGSLKVSSEIVNLTVNSSTIRYLTETFNSTTMFGVEIDYTLIHSGYTSIIELGPLDLDDDDLDLPDWEETNLTHIGVGFYINETTMATRYEEYIRVSYGSQSEFLRNIDIDTLGLYYHNESTGTNKNSQMWLPCTTMEHDAGQKYILSSIPEDWRDPSQRTKFVLFANSSSWNRTSFTVTTEPAHKSKSVDHKDLVITVTFSNPIIESTMAIELLDDIGDGNIQEMLYKPNYDENTTSVSFRMKSLDYDSTYKIHISYVMDEYRQTIKDHEYTFHTKDEPVNRDDTPIWYWIVAGAILLLLILVAVYFLVIRKRKEEEEEEKEIFSCSRCGFVLEGEEVRDCPECGFEMKKKAEAVVEMKFINCPECQAKIDGRSKICPFCSKKVGEEQEEVEEKEKIVEEEVLPPPPAAMGLQEDTECPTCGTMVEKGMEECPACGEVEF
ncbi:MAG: PKD domain-containing protein [Candidatus Thermoplasmatota archaeon]|nr:PKD domain-containing protein [Candidatus Thermoplasmatota archaeon]MDP7265182.1 PKD domain-containing protein [Candidatus Thermoplasmatota archaeon]